MTWLYSIEQGLPQPEEVTEKAKIHPPKSVPPWKLVILTSVKNYVHDYFDVPKASNITLGIKMLSRLFLCIEIKAKSQQQ